MAKVEIWVDGCAEPNPGPGGWGVVAKRGGETTELSGDLAHITNNRAELTAVLKGLQLCTRPGDEVVVHTDSRYCIGVLSGRWKKAKANWDLTRAIWEASRRREVRYEWVSGEDNWRADFLSRLNLPDQTYPYY